jgi:hypothetical protein
MTEPSIIYVKVVKSTDHKSGFALKWVGDSRPGWIYNKDGTFGWYERREYAETAASVWNVLPVPAHRKEG